MGTKTTTPLLRLFFSKFWRQWFGLRFGFRFRWRRVELAFDYSTFAETYVYEDLGGIAYRERVEVAGRTSETGDLLLIPGFIDQNGR